jgi:hypothetical protein
MAGTYTWIGATNDPSLASNWQFTAGVDNPEQKPLDGDTAIIPGGATVPPLLSDSVLVANTLDVVGDGIVQFANGTTIAFNSALDNASVINA